MAADDTKARQVFVTVGTTSFDALIATVTQPDVIEVLKKLGYRRLLLQIGRGETVPDIRQNGNFKIEHYRYKDSLSEDMQRASLVISHAGAGSVLEALGFARPLVVVINEELMGNHQVELAEQLRRDGHLYYTTCRELKQTLETCDMKALHPLEPGQPVKFATFLDKMMGIS